MVITTDWIGRVFSISQQYEKYVNTCQRTCRDYILSKTVTNIYDSIFFNSGELGSLLHEISEQLTAG